MVKKCEKILWILLFLSLIVCIMDLYLLYSTSIKKSTDIDKYAIELIIQNNNSFKQQQKDIEIFLQEKEILNKVNELTTEEWECLYRVARAEAGANSKEGQKNVVYVVLNRLHSEKFPNTIEEIVFQSKPAKQFVCVWDGNYDKVEISDFTIQNVQEAYLDYKINESADGALFFTTKSFKCNEYLFTDEVGHNFYK